MGNENLEEIVGKVVDKVMAAKNLPREEYLEVRAQATLGFDRFTWPGYIHKFLERKKDLYPIPEIMTIPEFTYEFGRTPFHVLGFPVDKVTKVLNRALPDFGVLNPGKAELLVRIYERGGRGSGPLRQAIDRTFFRNSRKNEENMETYLQAVEKVHDTARQGLPKSMKIPKKVADYVQEQRTLKLLSSQQQTVGNYTN